MLSFQVPVLGSLFVSFRPSLIRSHSCSSGASLLLSLSGFPLPLSFLSSASLPVPATQPSALSFPLFPVSPRGGSSGAAFASLFRPACFHAFLPIPVLSFLLFFSPAALSPHSGYLSASAFFLSAPGLFPLAFALGSGYSALRITLSGSSCPCSTVVSAANDTHITTCFFICQHPFLFLTFLFIYPYFIFHTRFSVHLLLKNAIISLTNVRVFSHCLTYNFSCFLSGISVFRPSCNRKHRC